MISDVHFACKRTAVAVLVSVAACICQLRLVLIDMQLMYTES
jgi:hypothetical protein